MASQDAIEFSTSEYGRLPSVTFFLMGFLSVDAVCSVNLVSA